MRSSFLEYLGIAFHVIAIGVAVYGIYLCEIKHPGDVLNEVLFISVIILFVLSLILFKKYLRYKRYYNAYPYINNAFSSCNEISNPDIPDMDLRSDLATLRIFCTHVKEAFEIMTNRYCSVCIKFLMDRDSKPHLITLIRDNDAETKLNRPSSDKDKQEKMTHWLARNTAFRHILVESADKIKNKYYQSNGLPWDDWYENTRFEEGKYPPKTKIWVYKELRRWWKWPLWYRSCIVVPIVPLAESNLDKCPIEGFLCVDSNSMGAFDLVRDKDIMMGIADGMYASIRSLRKRHFPENQ